MTTTAHLDEAYSRLTEAQRKTSHHRKERHLCARCRERKKCAELIKLSILESHALAKWIGAYEDASGLAITQATVTDDLSKFETRRNAESVPQTP